jgi:hypothetical protein
MKESRPIQYIYFDTSAARQKSLEAFAEYALLADKTNHARVELIFTPIILSELTGGECFSKEDVMHSQKTLPRNLTNIFREYGKYIYVPKPNGVDEAHVEQLFERMKKAAPCDGLVGVIPTFNTMCQRIATFRSEHFLQKGIPAFEADAGDDSLISHFTNFLHSVFSKIHCVTNGNTNIEFILVSNDAGLQALSKDAARRYNALEKFTSLGKNYTPEVDWLKSQTTSIPSEMLNSDAIPQKEGIMALLSATNHTSRHAMRHHNQTKISR